MHGLGLINYRRGWLDAALALILPTGKHVALVGIELASQAEAGEK